jgi:hypothetical protein
MTTIAIPAQARWALMISKLLLGVILASCISGRLRDAGRGSSSHWQILVRLEGRIVTSHASLVV